MLKLYGFDIDDFTKFKPEPNSVVISFVSKIDKAYDPNLYAKLPSIYQQYDDVLVIKADDISEPTKGCRIFTKRDAQNITDFVKEHQNKNIVVHCNAGVSRTGSVIHYIQQECPDHQLIDKQQFSFNPLISRYLDVHYDNIIRLFNH